MKKTYKLQDLDCANCAAKIEEAINRLEKVESATVSFMTQKLVVVAEIIDDELLESIKKVIKKVEPDCSIV